MLRRFAETTVAARAAAFADGARNRAARIKLRRKERRTRDLLGLSIAAHVVLWIFVGLAVVASTLFLFWISFDKPHLQSQASKGVGPAALFNAAKLALAVVAGIGGVVALVVAFRRQRLGEADHERQDRATARDETRLFTERFSRATEQLGSEQAAVRIAGVYALAGLADDWPSGRQTCVDVLCAYLRMPFQLRSPLPEYEPDEQQDKQRFADLRASMENPVAGRMAYPANEEHQVRSTIIRAIGDRMSELADVRWSGLNLDFTGAVFDEARFDGFIFDDCSIKFGDCIFVGETTFAETQILDSSLWFTGSVFLDRLDFDYGHFEDSRVTLLGAFGGRGFVSFRECSLQGGEIELLGPDDGRGNIRFVDSVLEAGVVTIHLAKMTGESSIDFSRSTIIGAEVEIHGGTFGSGTIHFNGVNVNGGLILFRPHEYFDQGKMKFSGAEFSFDGVALRDGKIRFDSIDIEGSSFHFGDLEMMGGEIRFVDVDLKSGSFRMDRPDITGGSIHLGEIAGTRSGQVIASEIGEFVRPVAALVEDVG